MSRAFRGFREFMVSLDPEDEMPARDAEAARACQPRKRKAAPLELEGPAVVTKRRALPSVGKHKPEPGEPASAAGLYHGSTFSGRQQVELSGPIMANRCLMGRAGFGWLPAETDDDAAASKAGTGRSRRPASNPCRGRGATDLPARSTCARPAPEGAPNE